MKAYQFCKTNLYVQYDIISADTKKAQSQERGRRAVFKFFNKFKTHVIILGFKVLNLGSADAHL